MKKTFTKLAGGIMAASMILGTVGVAAPQVFADDTATTPDYSITVNNAVEGDKGTHTYTAYQIFKAQEVVTGQDGKATKELKEITWGSAISASADGTTANFDAATKAALVKLFNGIEVPNVEGNAVTEDNCTKATVIANALSKLEDDSTKLKAFSVIMEGVVDKTTGVEAGTDNKAEVSDPGYYLVVDTNTTTGDKKDTYTSEFMLKVAGPTEINTKGDLPKSNKTVQDDEDHGFGDDSIDNKVKDTADYDIGDKVPFTLYGTVASNYDQYNVAYKYAFVDQFCAGLDNPTDIVVKATTKTGATVELKNATDASVTDKTTGYVIGAVTKIENPTDAYVKEWKVSFADLNKVQDKDGNAVTGITEIRVTYNSVLNKNAQIGTTAGNPNKSHIEYSNNPNNDEEGKSEDTHVKVFTYEYDVDKTDANNKPLEGAGFTLYKVSGNTETPVYVDADGKVLNAEEIAALGANASAEVKPASGNQFKYIGLDAGDYKLVETTVPDGYNKAKDITFTVKATQEGTDNDTAGTDECVVEKVKVGDKADDTAVGGENGIFNSTVINNSGAELPSTGGIGTTIFYIVGAAAAVTAIVLLTTRRRANKND